MPYFLFLLVTATLFIRPGEIVESTRGWPIYEYAILACLAVSIGPVLQQLSRKSLSENPITACVVGLLVDAAILAPANASGTLGQLDRRPRKAKELVSFSRAANEIVARL